MKFNRKMRVFVVLALALCMLFAVTAYATETGAETPVVENGASSNKLPMNMSGADMPFSERLEYALQGTATGMVMVFAVLALLWGIVSLSKVFFYDIPNKKKAEAAGEKSAPVAPVVAPTPQVVPETVTPEAVAPATEDDGAIIAAITAAIAAMIESGDYGNEFAGGFRVVSFKRSTKGAWNRK